MKTILILDESPSNKDTKNYDVLLDNFEIPICVTCGREIIKYWDPRYRGERASCNHCGINWAES